MQGALNLGHDGLVVGLDAIKPAVKGGHGRKRSIEGSRGRREGESEVFMCERKGESESQSVFV